jgi:hypothetical protein
MRAVSLQMLSSFTDWAAGQGQKSSPRLARLSILGLDSHAAWPVCARHHRCVGVALDTRFLRWTRPAETRALPLESCACVELDGKGGSNASVRMFGLQAAESGRSVVSMSCPVCLVLVERAAGIGLVAHISRGQSCPYRLPWV